MKENLARRQGANIPSLRSYHLIGGEPLEKFFNLPLYRYGNIIKNIQLEFKEGIALKQPLIKMKITGKHYPEKMLTRLESFLTDKDFPKF